jgi:hypothetical protein
MNTCFTWERKNAGHWCHGLQITPYRDGNESTEAELAHVLVEIEKRFPSIEDVRSGERFSDSSLKSVNPFGILPWRSGLST